MTLEDTLLAVWKQALADGAESVKLDSKICPVRRTARCGLRQVDFSFAEHQLRGLEQNPETQSRWAKLARSRKRVMQFLEGGRYIAVVVDGKVVLCGKSKRGRAQN